MFRVKPLGLVAYLKPGATDRWLLPVCSSLPATLKRLRLLAPNNIGNWVGEDIDGCPTMCYSFKGRELRTWRKQSFKSVWPQFADRLGKGVAKEFFYDLWLKDVNHRAMARNRWELRHGGYRIDKFDRGMSVRTAASLSI